LLLAPCGPRRVSLGIVAHTLHHLGVARSVMFEDTPLWIIERQAEIPRLVERLQKATVLAVDTESDSMYRYQEKVCLIQFTDTEGDIILDPLKAPDLTALRPIFADRRIVKVFHGSDYDVVSLKRDFGFQTRNLFDTLIAAQFLGLEGLGLADLIGRYFGEHLDKKYQRHNWSERPLLEEHLEYARGDTHWLPALREILDRALRRAGKLRHHREECRYIERRKWTRKPFDPEGWVRIKRTGHLDDDARRVLRELYAYRDGQARLLDRPPYKVIGDSLLIDVATKRPATRDSLDRVLPRQSAMKRRHAGSLVDAVRRGLVDKRPLPTAASNKRDEEEVILPSVPARLTGRNAERVFLALKDWRNHLTEGPNGVTPFSVASNAVLKVIARARPLDLDELAGLPEVRRWQVRDHGEEILKVLDKHAPIDELREEPPSRKRRRRRD
jgi:ribonuclease D